MAGPQFATIVFDTILTAIGAELNGGKLLVYSGPEPATATSSLSGNILLAELSFASPAFGAVQTVSGERRISANAITSDPAANATGTATFYRAIKANNAVLLQGDVGTFDANLILSSTSVTVGQSIQVSDFSLFLIEATDFSAADFSADFNV